MNTIGIELLQKIEEVKSTGELAKALDFSRQLIDLDLEAPQGYLVQGDLYNRLGNVQKAVEAYQKALALRPGEAGIYFKLGQTYEAGEQYQAALDNYNTAVNLVPEDASFKGRLGTTLYALGYKQSNRFDIQEGIRLMKEAHNKGKAGAVVKDTLALAYLQQAKDGWIPDPNEPQVLLATDIQHVLAAERSLGEARELMNPENDVLQQLAGELEQELEELTQKRYAGIGKFLKVPIVFSVFFFFIGASGKVITCLLLAGLYYLANRMPGYLQNRYYLKSKVSIPMAFRAIDNLKEILSQFSIFGSLPQVFFFTGLIRLLVRFIGAFFVMITLPIEIVKGFWVNYNWKEVLLEWERIKEKLGHSS